MPASPPAWLEGLDGLVPAPVLQALRDGADPNAPVAQVSPSALPLIWVINAFDRAQDRSKALAALDGLMAAGAHLVPPLDLQSPPDALSHPLAWAILQPGPAAFDTLIQRLPPDQAAALPQSLVAEGDQVLSLLDLALRRGNAPAATGLWEAGVRPHPGVPATAPALPRASTPVVAFQASANPGMAVLIQRLLNMPAWPQADLDAALHAGVPAGASLDSIDQLLALGARPTPVHGRFGATLPLLCHALILPAGQMPAPGVVGRLARATPDLHVLLDFDTNPANPLSGSGSSTQAMDTGAVSLAGKATHPGSLSPEFRAAQPLGLAAYRGLATAVFELIAAGADLHHVTSTGLTPLHLACHQPEIPTDTLFPFHVVSLLLDAGADPVALDCEGRTPLEHWISHRTASPIVLRSTLEAGRALLAATLAARPESACAIALALGRRNFPDSDLLARDWAQALGRFTLARDLEAGLPQSSPRLPKRI